MPIIACRRCGKALQYEQIKDLPYFPFCSKRCKLVDLGKWFNEEHRMPGEKPAEEDEANDGAPPHRE